MRRAREKLKEVFLNHEPLNPETSSRHLPTGALRIASLLLRALPFPGAEAAANPILLLVEVINVRAYLSPRSYSSVYSFLCRRSEE